MARDIVEAGKQIPILKVVLERGHLVFDLTFSILMFYLGNVIGAVLGQFASQPQRVTHPFPLKSVLSDTEELDMWVSFPDRPIPGDIASKALERWREPKVSRLTDCPPTCREVVELDYGYRRPGLVGVFLERYPTPTEAAGGKETFFSQTISWTHESKFLSKSVIRVFNCDEKIMKNLISKIGLQAALSAQANIFRERSQFDDALKFLLESEAICRG